MKFLRNLYRWFRYYRHDDYVSSEWLIELENGHKDDLIIT